MSGTSVLNGGIKFVGRIKFIPWLTALIIHLLSIPSIGFAAGTDEIQVPWSEIAALVEHQKVALVLPDGAMIEGQVLAVEADALVLDIKKSSEPRSHPARRTSVPRSSISVLQLKQVKGNRRWLGAAIGAAAGGVAGWLLAEGVFHVSGEGLNPSKAPVVVGSVAGLVAGAAAIGYFAGRKGDQRVTFIKIIPARIPSVAVLAARCYASQ
jgi:hypothetical protein